MQTTHARAGVREELLLALCSFAHRHERALGGNTPATGHASWRHQSSAMPSDLNRTARRHSSPIIDVGRISPPQPQELYGSNIDRSPRAATKQFTIRPRVRKREAILEVRLHRPTKLPVR